MGSKKQKLEEPNFLTPLLGKPRTKPVISFDVETYGTKNKFVLGVISFPDRNEVYDDPELMLAELSHPRNYGHFIYATNLAFDAFVLFQEVAGDRGIPPGWSAFDNGSKLIWCKKQLPDDEQKRYLALLDSMNLFPLGVYNLGSILEKVAKSYRRKGEHALADYYSVHKLDPPACMGKKKYSSLTPEELEQLTRYCTADAEVTRKFMEWANGEIVKLGAVPRITAASTSMDLFRRKYLTHTIPQPNYECLIDSRFSYYGGRTEDYFKGNVGEGDEQDVTAMYPSVMEALKFPYPSPENFTKLEKPSLSVLDFEGFARATVIVPKDMYYPPLPFRGQDHLLFPVGELNGIWTHLHLRHALEVGCEISSLDWSYYTTHTFNPFEGYVRELIKLRLQYLCPGCERFDRTGIRCWEDGVKCENADAIEEVIKLFLNGLYGKFAQNWMTEEEGEKYNLFVKKGGGTFKPIAEATSEEWEFTATNFPEYLSKGIVINKAVPSLKNFMNPILASYITSAAQCKINDIQLRGLKEGVTTYYTDTDSVLTNKRLSFAVKGKQLGQLQHVGSFDELIIIGPKAKMTRHGNKTKPTFKGIPTKSFVIEDPVTMVAKGVSPKQQMFDTMTDDKLTVTYTRFAKYREAMIRGLSVNEMTEMTKEYQPFANPKREILGKPTIKKLLTQKFNSRPWRIDGKTQLVKSQGAKK